MKVALGLLFAASAGFVAHASGLPKPAKPAPRVLGAAERLSGLRVGAEPGDFVLSNDAVVAVIRKQDGALVDFHRRQSKVATSEQLLATSNIDGIWDLLPVAVGPGGERIVPDAARVTLDADGVEVRAVLSRRRHSVGVRMRYTLDPTEPKIRIHAAFHAETAFTPAFEVGISVRWGNTSYFVDGNSEPLTTFSGFVRWAGRAGAGGDLLLRAIAPAAYSAQFQARERGFQGPLNAIALRPTNSSRNVAAVYELAYEPLPVIPAPARASGRLEIDVRDEKNRPLASKVTLFPNGQPNRVFPDDGSIDGADRFAWSGNGHIVCEPPAGPYALNVSAGPERALTRHNVVIEPGATSRISTVLKRVIQTPGWISADLHLHQAPSVDADISLESRIIAVAAEGVELAVATDHYAVTDFAPTVHDLTFSGALTQPMLTLPGTEVSTVGHRFGHFNVFPLPLDAAIEYANTTPARLFQSARKANPEAVLQVNHPRWAASLGYFTRFDVDPLSGVARKPGFDASFDTLEVYNGDDASQLPKVEKVLLDFMRLLGTGRRYAATGSSDSHKLAFLDPGLPRTMIAHGAATDDDTDVGVPSSEILRALKGGRAIVTSGPFIEVDVAGAGPGETAKNLGRHASLHVRVRAAPWVSVSKIRVFEGSGAQIAFRFDVPKSEALLRFEQVLTLELRRPTFVIVTASGDKPLPNTSGTDILPFAFTNPVWLSP